MDFRSSDNPLMADAYVFVVQKKFCFLQENKSVCSNIPVIENHNNRLEYMQKKLTNQPPTVKPQDAV